ncbi:MAG: hypothetical protein U0892_21915 [Pirellulales bacterium]
MRAERSHRGWIAAMLVATVLTLVVIAAEKRSREEAKANAKLRPSTPSWMVSMSGIKMESDPSIAVAPSAEQKLVSREPAAARFERHADPDVTDHLTMPPDPVASVVLHAPTQFPEMQSLALGSTRDDNELTEALEAALQSPMKTVSIERKLPETSAAVDNSRLHDVAAPTQSAGAIPEPTSLIASLTALRIAATPTLPTSVEGLAPVEQRLSLETRRWVDEVEEVLTRLVTEEGLDHPSAPQDLDHLTTLSKGARSIADLSPDHGLATQLMRTAYAVERRAKVWYAIGACVTGGWEEPKAFPVDQVARRAVHQSAKSVAARIARSQEAAAWSRYLELDSLLAWSSGEADDWKTGNTLAKQILTRINWERLTQGQRQYLQADDIKQLAEHLTPWATEPIDYRQLLMDIELLEQDPTNRCRASLAAAVETLRVSPYPQHRMTADAINDHYRNANIRLAVSGKLIDRLLPQDTVEARPVRQRILGADTRGNSQVHTQLGVKLIPDNSAWHLELGMIGDMKSATQSSKGPAVFNSTSTAKINSARTIRMDLNGMKVTADPTLVDTRQHLQSMSTDLDPLPIVGDFFRYVVREQFEQQRGVAQRVAKRIIANETDQEIDRQLSEQIKAGEKQIKSTFVGPLERLGLDPIVVQMATTEDRMIVRYRVAGDGQMAAHTARPRAPSDSLLSLQVHQSAVNNAIGQLGLSDRTWTLPELCGKLATAFDQQPWELPSDVTQDIQIRFAPTRPITVELNNGKLELTLRIAELRIEDKERAKTMHFERFIIRTTYVPVAEGMHASLVRDGVVSIDGPRLGASSRIPLRAIFGKIFAARSTIRLINDKWEQDPRAQGLAVSQIEVADGWLGLAVSESESPHAERTAAAARQLLMQ